jgi:curved DNA-binding protein CbpA
VGQVLELVAPAAPVAPSPEVTTEAPISPPPEAAAAPTPDAPAAEAVAEAEASPAAQLPDPSASDPRRLEILDAWEDLKTKNHFEVLGITPEATDAQVREAYFRLARRFHPDVHHRGDLADLREKVENVFIRLGEAYEVLRNPRIRASYERDLKSRSGQSAPSAPAAEDPEELSRAAEKSIERAARSVSGERYWEAIQLLEPAIHRVQGRTLQKGRVLLARAYARNPNWVKQGEELLLTVLQEDPRNADACFSLAEIYRASGLKSRAASMYRRLLEIAPEHEEARSQLAALEPEGPAERPGLLKRLFKKDE